MIQVLRFLPAAIIISISCLLSSMPTIEQMPSFWNADKLVHLICFGGLAFWLAYGLYAPAWRASHGRALWLWLVPVVTVAVYGGLDEIHQSFTPGRNCSWLDWMADVLGAMLGSYVHLILATRLGALSRWWSKFAGVEVK